MGIFSRMDSDGVTDLVILCTLSVAIVALLVIAVVTGKAVLYWFTAVAVALLLLYFFFGVSRANS